MALESTNIEDTEQEDADQAALEAKRKEELENLRKEANEAKLARARAEGESEALRRIPQAQPQQAAWSDEQWEQEASKYGMSGTQLKSTVFIGKGMVDAASKPLQEEIAAARREAQEAKAEAKRVRERKSLESVEQDFYDKNPVLRLHKKHVEEFLSTYPDADNVDEKTLQRRLSIAADVVKGKVKENMRTSKPGESGSSRMESSDEETSGELGDFDPKGTGNSGAAQLMAQVHSNFGSGIKRKDSIDVWKKSLDEEGRGVSISMQEDMDRYQAMQDKDVIGGKRG